MKIFVQNTIRGLVPCDDSDYDLKKKLKIGQVYSVDIKLARNYEFHKKYFALLRCAWSYQPEKVTNFFKNIDGWRKYIEVSAGFYELLWSSKFHDFVQVPKSISFEKMDKIEFSELYERVKDILYNSFLRNIDKEVFEKQLLNF